MDISSLYQYFLASKGIETDTRKDLKDKLFFALKGANFNGNKFVADALEKGAVGAVVDEEEAVINSSCFLVSDCLTTLQSLAQHHRNQLKTQIICIGGSNGKTTTKELVYKVLSSQFNTFATPGNFNNHIGVPLSLLQITKEDQFAIIEIGANHEGEHKQLMEIAQPDFALMTNYGKDHLEGFGDVKGVIKANNEIIEHQLKHNRPMFANASNTELANYLLDSEVIWYANEEIEHATCYTDVVQKFPFLQLNLVFDKEVYFIQTKLFGMFQAANIAAAACIGHYFGVPVNKIIEAISQYEPTNNRAQIVKWKENTIVLDAYNANPSSVEAILSDFLEMNASPKGLILGSMLELGKAEKEEHEKIGELLNGNNLDWVVLVGSQFKKVAEKHKFTWFPNTLEAKEWWSTQDFKNHTILIKGSRGLALEKILA